MYRIMRISRVKNKLDYRNDGIMIGRLRRRMKAEDGSLCGIGRPIRIEAGSVEEFAKAFDEAFFKD
jgi:hypothetical protein